MEPTLVIIGLNFRTSAVAVRERFWMNEEQRYAASQALVHSEGVDEAMVLATCNRTEFIVWASDPSEGANSVLRFLTREFNLKLSEWSNFYRLVDDAALLHLFRVTAGLDSMALGDPEIVTKVNHAWQVAQGAGTTGRFLDTILQKAITVSERARMESGIAASAISVPYAAVALSKQVFGNLEERRFLLIGASTMSELAGRYLMKHGARNFTVVNRTLKKAQDLARELNGRAVSFDDRLKELADADVVVSSTSSAEFMITKADVEQVADARNGSPLLLIDMALPRDIDPGVRELPKVVLHNMDDLEQVIQPYSNERRAAAAHAEKILGEEVDGFRLRLMSEQVVPTIVALRHRLEEICGQELRSLEDQYGPFTEDQQHALHSLASHITQHIAGSMARELKELPERAEQQLLAEAVQRLFHLQPAKQATPALKH